MNMATRNTGPLQSCIHSTALKTCTTGTSDIYSDWHKLWHTQSNCSREPENSFDWFKSYSQLSSLFWELIPDKASRILMLGCGNSKLSEEVRPSFTLEIDA